MRCGYGRIWINYLPLDERSEEELASLERMAVPLLTSIAQRLPANGGGSGQVNDVFAFKATVLLAIAGGFAINGLIQSAYLGVEYLLDCQCGFMPVTLEREKLFGLAAAGSAGILVVLVIAAIWLVGRSARAHFVLLELLLFGAPGIMASTFIALREMNMERDRQPAVERNVVARKYTYQHTLDKGTSFYLVLPDLTGHGPSKKYQVSDDVYRTVDDGETASLAENPGYLGVRWIESMTSKNGMVVK